MEDWLNMPTYTSYGAGQVIGLEDLDGDPVYAWEEADWVIVKVSDALLVRALPQLVVRAALH